MTAALAYRAGHGIGVQLASTLVTVNEALYVGTWFLIAFFLLAAGALAVSGAGGLSAGARSALPWSRWSQLRSRSNGRPVTVLLWFAWIVFASVALARGERVLGGVGAVAQSA